MGLARELPLRLGERAARVLELSGPTDERGWQVVHLPFDSLEQAHDKILGFGGAAEVLEPLRLARSLADYAEQIRSVYLTPRQAP